MVTPSRKAAAQRGAARSASRALQRGTALQKRPSTKGALTRLLEGLKSFSTRSGSALGAAYAQAAGSLLDRVERLEDASAERQLRHRSRAASAASSPTAAEPARPQDSLSPAAQA